MLWTAQPLAVQDMWSVARSLYKGQINGIERIVLQPAVTANLWPDLVTSRQSGAAAVVGFRFSSTPHLCVAAAPLTLATPTCTSLFVVSTRLQAAKGQAGDRPHTTPTFPG